MKALLLLLVTILGLTACTTSAVRMSPEETQSFFNENTELSQALNEGMNKVSAQSCESESGPCWKIECIGNKCWKTEMETPPEGLFQKTTEKPSLAKANCESPSEPNAARRKGCLEYINYLGEIKSQASIAESVNVLKIMCDLNGVSCKKNYNKFGTGSLKIDDERSQFKSGQLKIYTYMSSGSKSVVIYDYSVLQ